jgi:alpha-tubulin suppressor-like RCC1 family protein
MSQSRAQLVAPIGNVDVNGGIVVSGVTTAGTLAGNITGTATGFSGTPDLNVGVITATSFVGDGSNLTGIAATPFTGQNVTSISGITTIDLSAGNVIYFTHDADTTVAFANTSTTQSLTFIRTKDDTSTARNLTWPLSVIWNNGVTPLLNNNPRSTDAQQFNLLTRDGGETWYAREEVNVDPQTFGLFSWGANSVGLLGQNNITPRSSPVQIPGTSWNSISSSSDHSLATKTDGTLWAWGLNQQGRLGQNNQTTYSSPVQIPGTTWSSVSTGIQFSLATKTDGTLWSWGNNSSGQLAQNNVTQYSSPVQIPGTTWSSVSGGGDHSLATKTDGTLWSWGFNFFGALGQGNRTNQSSPVQIPGTSWSFISTKTNSVLATKTDGTLWSWGRNQQGELGQSNTTQYSSPVQIPGTTWSSISSGNIFSLATKTDGTLWSWGYNAQGRLGQNDTINYSSPAQIPGTTWSFISTGGGSGGGAHSLATKTDGTLWAWGNNSSGQLGQNNRTYYSSPVQIPGTEWSSISSGSNHSLATQITS